MRLDFSSVGCDDSLSNAHTDLPNFVALGVLLLDLLVLDVLSLLPLLSVLLVVTESRKVPGDVHSVWNSLDFLGDSHNWRRVRTNWRT